MQIQEDKAMVESYEDLHKLLRDSFDKYSAEHDLEDQFVFTIEDNGVCKIWNKVNEVSFKFMLAQYEDEYKIGFAKFVGYNPNPTWIDDLLSSNFDDNFMQILIEEHVIADPEEY